MSGENRKPWFEGRGKIIKPPDSKKKPKKARWLEVQDEQAEDKGARDKRDAAAVQLIIDEKTKDRTSVTPIDVGQRQEAMRQLKALQESMGIKHEDKAQGQQGEENTS